MYSETHAINKVQIHNGTLSAMWHHFQPGHLSINGLDPTDHHANGEQLQAQGQIGSQVEIAANTGDPQTDRDAVHIARGIIDLGRNPWLGKPGDTEVRRLPLERYNDAANHLREGVLGLPPEPVKPLTSAAVSVEMTQVTSKWQVVALGELQQPGGVGATQNYNPVVDGPNPDGPNFADNAGNSPEQEVALQTWVNTAIDLLNRGEPEESVVAQLAHDGCPDPQAVLQRALQQPGESPVSDEIGQDPFEAPPTEDPLNTGGMESLSQQPQVLAKRVRIAGTTQTGIEIDRWEDMWGQGTVKIALDDGGTLNVTPDVVEEISGEGYKHPVTEIQAFIDSMPAVEPTRPYIEARLANLELVRRAVRANISKVGFSDQVKLQSMDSDAEAEAMALKDFLAADGVLDLRHEVTTAPDGAHYLSGLPMYRTNAFRVAEPEITPFTGNPKEAGAIWATEGAWHDETPIEDFHLAAIHFAEQRNMSGEQFGQFLKSAEDVAKHRHVRTEEFTATEPEITENEGPAEALFVR